MIAYDTEIIDFLVRKNMFNSNLFQISPFYKNDMCSRKANILFNCSDTEISEISSCAKDILRFTQHLGALDSGRKRKSAFVLRDYQREFLEKLQEQKFAHTYSERQSGATILHCIEVLNTVFKKDTTAVVVSHSRDSAQDILSKIVELYRNVPFYMKPGIEELKKGRVIFDNGSRIIAPSESSFSLGFNINHLFVDNADHMNKKFILELCKSWFPICSSLENSKVRIISEKPIQLAENLNESLFAKFSLSNQNKDAERT